MVEGKKDVGSSHATRMAWARPEVRRMVAGAAETAFVSGTDGATQAS